MSKNNQNRLWRAVSSSTDPLRLCEEIFAFVDAPDYETAKELLYQRLSLEWGISRGFIDFYNLDSEEELREQALGALSSPGAPLLEIGWSHQAGGGAIYDNAPLILVASAALRAILTTALYEIGALSVAVEQEATCVGCGCTDSHACVDENRNVCYWLKVNRETGLGVCSSCDFFLNHPLTDDHD